MFLDDRAEDTVAPSDQPGSRVHPVRAEDPERVPTLSPPAFGDAATLEHDVVGGGRASRPAPLRVNDGGERVGRQRERVACQRRRRRKLASTPTAMTATAMNETVRSMAACCSAA